MPCSVVTSSFRLAGASFASAWAILRVKLSLRRLPTMTTMGCGVAMGGPYGFGREELPLTYLQREKDASAWNVQFGNAAFAQPNLYASGPYPRGYGPLVDRSQDAFKSPDSIGPGSTGNRCRPSRHGRSRGR